MVPPGFSLCPLYSPQRQPKAFTPIEIGRSRRSALSVGLRRRKRRLPGQRRLSRRLKSAFPGTYAPGVGSADAKDTSPVGAGRPPAEGPWRPNSFGAHADRRPKAFTPIEIGLPRRSAPGVGLRRRKRHLPGRRRPTVGRRPREAEFIRPTGRPPATGPPVEFIRHPPRHASASTRASPTFRLIPGPANPKREKAPPYPIARRACATSASSGASPAAAQARR
jgi:hypothetical protein